MTAKNYKESIVVSDELIKAMVDKLKIYGATKLGLDFEKSSIYRNFFRKVHNHIAEYEKGYNVTVAGQVLSIAKGGDGKIRLYVGKNMKTSWSSEEVFLRNQEYNSIAKHSKPSETRIFHINQQRKFPTSS